MKSTEILHVFGPPISFTLLPYTGGLIISTIVNLLYQNSLFFVAGGSVVIVVIRDDSCHHHPTSTTADAVHGYDPSPSQTTGYII